MESLVQKTRTGMALIYCRKFGAAAGYFRDILQVARQKTIREICGLAACSATQGAWKRRPRVPAVPTP